MSTEDRLFVEVYKISLLIENGVALPGEAFRYVATGVEEIDKFFAEFWNGSEKENYQSNILAQCKILTEKYPSFVLIQYVVGLWMYVDFNAFHYNLRLAALQYALRCMVVSGGVLNETAKRFLETQLLSSILEEPFTEACVYMKAVDPTLCPLLNSEAALVPKEEYHTMFPDSEAAPYMLPESLIQKITDTREQTGADISPQSIAAEMGWYSGLLESFVD